MPTNQSPIRSTFANDPEMQGLVEFFVQEMPNRVASLRKAYESEAVADLTRLSHQLKGASGGYGFPTLGEKAGHIESALKAGAGSPTQALAGIKADLEALIDMCNRVSS